jgi:transcriptional regulator with XRE-family HTH domain
MDLRDTAKMSRSYLSQIESGSRDVSIKIICRLANALEAEPEEFFKRQAKRYRR